MTDTSQEGVSGAPRAGGLVGKVYIYDLTDFTIKQELQGEMVIWKFMDDKMNLSYLVLYQNASK